MDDLLDLNWSSNSTPNLVNKQKQQQQKKDAFADLLPASSSSKSNDSSSLSLLEQQRRQTQAASWAPPASTDPLKFPKSTPQFVPSPSYTPPSNTVSSAPNSQTSFEDLLDPFATSQKKSADSKNTSINQLRNASKTGTPSKDNEQWNFDLLDAKPITFDSKKTAASNVDSFDFDFSVQNNQKTTMQTSELVEQHSIIASNGDPFDLDVLVQESQKATTSYNLTAEYNDDNPLGILAAPVQPQKDNKEHIVDPPSIQSSEPFKADEDEMLANLIDMGFSLQQSKFAIEATGGHNFQLAIDLLMQNSEPAQRYHPKQFNHSNSQSEQNEQITNRYNNHQQKQRQGGEDTLNFQTEKIVGQAQELGGMLYKNATSFLKSGREKVTKAVGDWQEQQRAQRLRQLQEQQKGPIKPKWMTNNIESADVLESPVEKFSDDNNPHIEQMSPGRNLATAAKMSRPQPKPKTGALINDIDEPVYVSPSRRKGTPTASGRATPQPMQHGSTSPKVAQQAVAPKPRERTRPVVNASPDTVLKVNQARIEGNERFKLGQFGEAEEAYTRAIESLPSGHDHQVVLLNNRAMSRLKTGDYKRCIADCDVAIALSRESGEGSSISEGLTIQWRDQLLKSLNRKAEALENIEKYKEALTTYEEVLKIEGPTNSKVNQSMSRCRQALNPKKPFMKTQRTASEPKNEPRLSLFDPVSTPSSTVSAEELNKSKAVAEMRAKAAEQEAEEAERLLMTDDINTRLLAWKAGKEQNLRALLATLNILLWPGAQWKGAQMSDLVDIKKCKITYMKAIAKVHPDKLPANATVEHKMLASGIFASLNQAWDVFRLQNNI